MSRKYVAGGYCIQNDGGIGVSFCALEFGQCRSEDQFFRSSREALSAGAFRSCYSRSAVEDIYLGTCGDRCAADATSCGNAEFTPADGSSLSSLDPNCQVSSALFGNCNGRCVWSADACENGETFHLPGSGLGQGSGTGAGTGGGGGGNGGGGGGGGGSGGGGGGGGSTSIVGSGTEGGENECTCDKVQVGGCKYAGVPIYCAVSPDSCDEFQTYLSHTEVFEQENVECYLCREPTTPSPVASPVSTPSDSPTVSSSNGATSNFAMALGITFGIIGIVIIIVVAIAVHGRRQIEEEERNKKETNSNPKSPPPETVWLDNETAKESTPHMAENEEHSVGDISGLTPREA